MRRLSHGFVDLTADAISSAHFWAGWMTAATLILILETI